MSKKNYRKVKGTIGSDYLKKYDVGSNYGGGANYLGGGNRVNLLLEAMNNPDLLSDENTIYPERDYDADIDREAFAKKVFKAFDKLTDRQKAIVNAVQNHDTQEEAAKSLNIKQSTLAMTLIQIQKKIMKLIDKESVEGHEI